MTEKSRLADLADEKNNFDPSKFKEVDSEIKMVEKFGCMVPDVNYGPICQFYHFDFGSDQSMEKYCTYLDILGHISAPSFRVTKQLIAYHVAGQMIQGN